MDILVQETPINLHFNKKEVSERFYYYAIAKKLLSRNCDIQFSESTVKTAREEGLEDVHEFLEVNSFDENGFTQFDKITIPPGTLQHGSIQYEQIHMPIRGLSEAEYISEVKDLLNKGASIARKNKTSVIRLLALDKDASQTINQATLENKTPLLEAVRHGNVEATKLLLKAGARSQNKEQHMALVKAKIKCENPEMQNFSLPEVNTHAITTNCAIL